jgi:hypothetical protein
VSGLQEHQILDTVQKWGTFPDWVPARFATSTEERPALLQWVYCLGQSLPRKQQVTHRLIQSFIVVPCASMFVGVIRQTFYDPPEDKKAVVSQVPTNHPFLKTP